jgi:hypothetical protein
MLADCLTGEPREVDICVHAIVSGKDVTLALECRDHKRKADQIWIDIVRGNYANLPVDKVIAVARAGFAKTARGGSGEGVSRHSHSKKQRWRTGT